MKKPVIAPRTEGISDYFNDDSVLFFEPSRADSLESQIQWAWSHPIELSRVVERGYNVYLSYRWERQEEHFLSLTSALLS